GDADPKVHDLAQLLEKIHEPTAARGPPGLTLPTPIHPFPDKVNDDPNGRNHAGADQKPDHNSSKPGQANARLGKDFFPNHGLVAAVRPAEQANFERRSLRLAVSLMQSHGAQSPYAERGASQRHRPVEDRVIAQQSEQLVRKVAPG